MSLRALLNFGLPTISLVDGPILTVGLRLRSDAFNPGARKSIQLSGANDRPVAATLVENRPMNVRITPQRPKWFLGLGGRLALSRNAPSATFRDPSRWDRSLDETRSNFAEALCLGGRGDHDCRGR